MCDVSKNVSQDSTHVVHGRTHTQEELRQSRPLQLGGLRLLIALVVPVLVGIPVTYAVSRQTGYDVIGVGFLGIGVSTTALGLMVLAAAGNPVDWLREYWCRNVRGYAVAYWLDDQGKLVGQITTRLPPDWRSMSGESRTIYLPLGGWLHRPRFADRYVNLHKRGIRVRWPWYEGTPDKVWVADRDGARVKLWMHDALVLRGFGVGHDWFEICSKMLRDLERLEREHTAALALLLDVYDRIVATKRFIKSTQAKAITDDLRRQLNGLLPYDHPRSREFAQAPMAKAAPVAAKT